MHQIKICTEISKVISKLLSLLMWMYYFMYIRLSVMFITLHIDTKRELNKIKEISERFNKEEQNLVMCMKPVKKEINRLEDNLPWPPEPQNLVPEKFLIPSQLDLLLHSLLENDQGVLQPKDKSLKVSFVVYAVTNSPKVLMETHTENSYKILERQLQNTFILPLDCRCIFAFNFPCLTNPSVLLTYILSFTKDTYSPPVISLNCTKN